MLNFEGNLALKKENLYEQIADNIETKILSDPSMVGQRMPSEQTVADTFNVSRNVVRESFKVLKERGFIEIRNGAHAYIKNPGTDVIKSTVSRFIKLEQSDISDIFEVRYALEINAAKLAATRGDEETLKNCREDIELMEKNKDCSSVWAAYDYKFHSDIVKSTGNNFFFAIYDSVSTQLEDMFEKAWGNKKAMEDGLMYHRNILSAIEQRDADRAVELVVAHLDESKRQMQEYFFKKDGENNG